MSIAKSLVQATFMPCPDKPSLLLPPIHSLVGFPGGAGVKHSPARAGDTRDAGSILGLGSRKWQTTPVFLLVKFHGERSLVGYRLELQRVRPDWARTRVIHSWCLPARLLQLCSALCSVWSGVRQAPVHGILQAGILERAAIPFSRGPSRPRDRKHVTCTPCIGRRALYQWCHPESPFMVQGPEELLLTF